MTDNMKQFLDELAELLEKRGVEIESMEDDLQFNFRPVNGAWSFLDTKDRIITHETLKELLK